MSPVLDQVREAIGLRGLRLRKAVPREPDHLVLDLVDRDGATVGGQWFADLQRADRVGAQTRARSEDASDVTTLGTSGVVVQAHGADRRLAALHALAAAEGASLLAHRPERRGVVRHPPRDGKVRYTKVVPAHRVEGLLAAARVHPDGVTVPRVTARDARAGTVTWAELPGRTLHEVLADERLGTSELGAVGRAVGAAIARLHAAPSPPAVGEHPARSELEVTLRWLRLARSHGVLPQDAPVADSVRLLRRLLSESASRPAYLHRDLHDKQILLDGDGGVGVVDLDLAAVGEPALDLANLLVHLRLRAVQGHCPRDRAEACAAGVLAGYAPPRDVRRRLAGYELSARLRLTAVYGYRPRGVDIGSRLLTTAAAVRDDPLERR